MIRKIILSLVLFLVFGITAQAAQQDVTSSLTISPTGFLLNRTTGTFDSKVTLTNKSTTTFGAPLWLVISGLPSGTSLANASGVTPAGVPYILVPLTNNQLLPTGSVSQLVRVNNPNRVSIKPTFSVLAQPLVTVPNVIGLTQTHAGSTLNQLNLLLGGDTSLNNPTIPAGNIMDQIPKAGTAVASGSKVNILVSLGPPAGGYQLGIVSYPPVVAVVGKLLQYQVAATSSNPSTLSYALTTAPSGMTIDATTGKVAWTPSSTQIGDQSVTITAQDVTGQMSQSFTLSVFGATPVSTAFISAQTGGTITVNNPGSNINGLTITIPPGALSADTTFTISGLIAPRTLGGSKRFLMKGFMVEPDGTALSKPATVKIPYSTSEFDTSEGIPLEDFLGVDYVNTARGELIGMTNFSVDTVNHWLTGYVPHFSVYISTNLARLCPPPAATTDCPDTYTYSGALNNLPAVMVHGFQISLTSLVAMGDEGTWGELRYLLGDLDQGGNNRVDAWRFDWDTKTATFESSAGHLSRALAVVKSMSNRSAVNIVAHSFGGILVRTYLEGMAATGGFNNDVNKVMTLGSPHQGIGGNFSNYIANTCAWSSVNLAVDMAIASAVSDSTLLGLLLGNDAYFETCHEAATGIGDGSEFHQGDFLRQLDHEVSNSSARSLPALLSNNNNPQYLIISGTRNAPGSPVIPDDGLITLPGADLCAADPSACDTSVPDRSVLEDTPIAGLCHSSALMSNSRWTSFLPCDGNVTKAMVAVNDQGHPLWNKICAFLGSIDCSPPNTTIVINNLSELQGISSNLGGNYVLGADIDATLTSEWNGGAGFAPIGNSTTPFTGTFDGRGHSINNLTIYRPTTDNVGLFGYISTGSTVQNLGLTGGNVTGQNHVGGMIGVNISGSVNNSYVTASNVYGSGAHVGGLVGYNNGSISKTYTDSSNVSGTDGVGGLVGENNSGDVNGGYVTASNVYGSGSYVGGLVGYNSGSIRKTYADSSNVSGTDGVGGLVGENNGGDVNNSYVTASDVYGSGSYIGGLVGYNNGTISNTYTDTGNVSGTDGVGGLVGHNNLGTVGNSYATVAVSGITNVGGLVGYNNLGTVSSSFWDTLTSGIATSAGGIGMTTLQMMTQANFISATADNGNINPAWDFTNIWTMIEGSTRPLFITTPSSFVYNQKIDNSAAIQFGPAILVGSFTTDASTHLIDSNSRVEATWQDFGGFCGSNAFVGLEITDSPVWNSRTWSEDAYPLPNNGSGNFQTSSVNFSHSNRSLSPNTTYYIFAFSQCNNLGQTIIKTDSAQTNFYGYITATTGIP